MKFEIRQVKNGYVLTVTHNENDENQEGEKEEVVYAAK